MATLSTMAACGGANAGVLGPGGSGGSAGVAGAGGAVDPPPVEDRTFRLNCVYGTLELAIPIELVVELTEPYSNSRPTEATFSAAVILNEESVAALIEEGISSIDIVSASVTSDLTGATPQTMSSSLGTPLNDFDLLTDTDDNGEPGPHRFALDPMTATSSAAADVREVTFGLELGGIELVLGDFNIPTSCFDRSLVGVEVKFPVHL